MKLILIKLTLTLTIACLALAASASLCRGDDLAGEEALFVASLGVLVMSLSRVISRKGSPMSTEPNQPNLAAKLPEICCPAWHLYQLYRGKDHTKCIHCGRPLDLSQPRPKLGVEKRGISDIPKR